MTKEGALHETEGRDIREMLQAKSCTSFDPQLNVRNKIGYVEDVEEKIFVVKIHYILLMD